MSLNFIDKAKKKDAPSRSLSGSTRLACICRSTFRTEVPKRCRVRMDGQKKKLAWHSWMMILASFAEAEGRRRTIMPIVYSPPITAPRSSPVRVISRTPFAQSRNSSRAAFACARCRWPGRIARRTRCETASSRVWTVAPPSSRRLVIRISPKNCWLVKKIGDRTYKNHLDGYNQLAAIWRKDRP